LEDPTGFIAGTSGPTIIDEIQRAPDLMLALKARLDADDTPGQFLITGSANLTQIRTVKDALPGRVLYLDIWPLSQAEIEGSATRVIDRLMDGMIPTVRDAPIGPLSYVERFVRGGFPGPLRGSPLIRRRFFDSYVDSVVERDVPDIAALRSLDSPGRILRLLSARSATLLNVASLARDLQLDNKTVDHHLRILSDLMLIRLHRPWFANLGSRQTKAPKIYVSDPGLMEPRSDGVLSRDGGLHGDPPTGCNRRPPHRDVSLPRQEAARGGHRPRAIRWRAGLHRSESGRHIDSQ
jgi:predicted AAA+ superfamily ATPase